jgi:tetratricopeptide (TPR) repeat protein
MPGDRPPVDLSVFANMPDENLQDILDAIREGAKTPGEIFRFDAGSLNALESIALGFYRTRLYDRAAMVYGFALRLDQSRGSCWRGLGACAQANKEYKVASTCYEGALERQPTDLISKALLGECFCLAGKTDEGLKILKEVVATGSSDPVVQPYVARARTILGAGGGIPRSIVLRNKGIAIAEQAIEMAAQAEATLDPSKEMTAEDIKKHPQLGPLLQEMTKAFEEGRITLAEVGGFTPSELEGAYVCACKYAEMDRTTEAMQIAGYLIFIDPYKARYYQLVGICMQRLKVYEAAEHFYSLALKLEPDEPRTLIFRGEARLMLGKVDEGLLFIKQGAKNAEGKPEYADVAKRAGVLLRQFDPGA